MATLFRDYWKDNEAEAVEFLDSIPVDRLKAHLAEGMEMCEIESEFDLEFGDEYREKYKTDSDLFDALSSDELQDYLEIRLGCKFSEVSYTVLKSL